LRNSKRSMASQAYPEAPDRVNVPTSLPAQIRVAGVFLHVPDRESPLVGHVAAAHHPRPPSVTAGRRVQRGQFRQPPSVCPLIEAPRTTARRLLTHPCAESTPPSVRTARKAKLRLGEWHPACHHLARRTQRCFRAPGSCSSTSQAPRTFHSSWCRRLLVPPSLTSIAVSCGSCC
jgi:hypothetical protein